MRAMLVNREIEVKVSTTALGLLASIAIATSGEAATLFLGADQGTGIGNPGAQALAAEAGFAAAAGDTSSINFEKVPAGAFATRSLLPGVTLTGQDFFGANQQVLDTPSCIINCGGNTTDGGAKFVQIFGGTLTVTFANAIDAFGVYIGGVQTDSVTLRFNNGAPQAVVLDSLGTDPVSGVAALNFVGFVDATKSILSVTIDAGNDTLSFDDLRFSYAANAPGIPEPASWAMMIAGFGLAGGALRSRSRPRLALG
jgi:hypothetical protein